MPSREPDLRDDLQALTSAIRALDDRVKKTGDERAASNSSIRIDAGGVTPLLSAKVAAICCSFLVGLSLGMMGMVIMGWIRLASVESSVNGNKAYLSAIFQKNPELKAEIDKSKEQAK